MVVITIKFELPYSLYLLHCGRRFFKIAPKMLGKISTQLVLTKNKIKYELPKKAFSNFDVENFKTTEDAYQDIQVMKDTGDCAHLFHK